MKVWPIDPLVPRNLRLEVPEKLPQVVVQVSSFVNMDYSSEENSPQSSQLHSSQPSAAQMLWENTFPSSDSDVLYAVGESQQTSASQAQEEDELMNGDVEGLKGGESHEPWQNKKIEAFYDMVADINMLKAYISGLKNTVQFGWCNLVLMATNKGEDSSLPNPESRKGYVQISYNKVNKVSISESTCCIGALT